MPTADVDHTRFQQIVAFTTNNTTNNKLGCAEYGNHVCCTCALYTDHPRVWPGNHVMLGVVEVFYVHVLSGLRLLYAACCLHLRVLGGQVAPPIGPKR